jgi:hypothetical protein
VHFANRNTRHAFAIFQETICDGVVPTWRDEKGFPTIYATEREAQIEIAETVIEHLQQFIAGEREFHEVVTEGDFVLPVEVWPDGTIQTENGLRFGAQEM